VIENANGEIGACDGESGETRWITDGRRGGGLRWRSHLIVSNNQAIELLDIDGRLEDRIEVPWGRFYLGELCGERLLCSI
jgi:hypothetical protein